MVKNIINCSSPEIKTVSEEIKDINRQTKQLIKDMTDTMYAAEGGAGLSAIQIGVPLRVMIAIVSDPALSEKGVLCLINPEITSIEGSFVWRDGCLCVPGVHANVTRPEKITVKAKNTAGKEITLTTGGWPARVIQHEVDHMDGRLFYERIPFFKRLVLYPKIMKIK